MKKWLDETICSSRKKALPILSFPCAKLLNVSVKELLGNADLQAKGIKAIADKVNSAVAISLMDLSVEAECFGATIRFFDNEVPAVTGRLIDSEEKAKKLTVPKVGSCRSAIYVDAIKKTRDLITDKPIIASMIGPFSLAARLMDVSQIMYDCYDEPETVFIVLEKVTEFLINYAKEFKKAGANGIVIAEPVAGLLSPALEKEFSSPYVKQIVNAVQDDEFTVIYHNCGAGVTAMIPSLIDIGADAYHFGNAINMRDMLIKMPKNILIMGNVDPVSEFKLGSIESITNATLKIMTECNEFDNFVISSGCDIPPETPWENILAFFNAVDKFYE